MARREDSRPEDAEGPMIEWAIDDEWIGDPARFDQPTASVDRPPALSCRSVVKVYPTATGRVLAVRGIDLDVEPGVATAFVGPSGSGKSSLLRMLAALDRPTAGSVEIDGVDLFALRPKARAQLRARLLTHVHQRPSDNLLSHLTARQQLVRLALWADDQRRSLPTNTSPNRGAMARLDPHDRVDDVLERLGLAHRRSQRPAALSGGEQQRLAFARAAVAGHNLVIADEPTAQLDGESVRRVLGAVDELVADGATVIIATHDQRVLPHVGQIVMLRDGAVASITDEGREHAVIDRSGRLQLPPGLRRRFPERRVNLRWDPDSGDARIERP